MQTDYLKLIDEYKDEMIETLCELVRIKSVEEEPVEVAEKGLLPFGAGVQEAFEYMLARGSADGFETENVDNYGGHIEFGGYELDGKGNIIGTSDEIMGILGHLDVVPEGELSGWDFGPYEGVVKDGKVYGRGTDDDKGATLAAYFAMKALKDSGFVPAKKVRLILGLDEETNWNGMRYYLSKVKKPDFGFTPDADFPAINGEKGTLVFEIAKKFGKNVNKGLELRSISGGSAPNVVADFARAVVRDDISGNYDKIKELAIAFRNETGYKLAVKGIGKSLEITAGGVSAHGATPWVGLNAVSVLMMFLSRLDIVNEDAAEFVEFYNKYIAFETDGTSIGCGFSDEQSGKLVFNIGMIEMDAKAVRLTVNVRYPVTVDADAVYDGMMPVLNKYNLGVIKEKDMKPIYMEPDSPFITTLMDVYRKHTGDTESKPLVIGGGTYAKACEGIVAFGPLFPGEPEYAHQPNECIKIENLVLAAKIYADAIYRLTKAE